MALESGAAYNEQGSPQAGMGLAVGDVNADGRLDLLKTHFADDIPALYRGLGKGLFEDVAMLAGLGVQNRHVEWGAGLPDLDNDGRPDILYVTGNVYPEVERQLPQYPHRGPRIVFRNLGGRRFADVSAASGAGATTPRSSRGAAFGDVDNDGDVDVLVMNMNEPPSLLRNDYTRLERLDHDRARRREPRVATAWARPCWSRPAAGRRRRSSSARPATTRTTTCGCTTGSARAPPPTAIEVRWPTGTVDVLRDVQGRRVVKIREGSAPAP